MRTAKLPRVVARDDPGAYRDILKLARRFVRTEADARDLAQDALMIALERGFVDWGSVERRSWLCGVLRRRAAFVSRTDSRRVRRERLAWPPRQGGPEVLTWDPRFLAGLPKSLRVVATLASADLCAAEIRWLLGLTPEALRTRLCALGRAVRAEDEPLGSPSDTAAAALGPRRTVLLAGLKNMKLPVVAAHDPDGHTILLRTVPHRSAGAATPCRKEGPHA